MTLMLPHYKVGVIVDAQQGALIQAFDNRDRLLKLIARHCRIEPSDMLWCTAKIPLPEEVTESSIGTRLTIAITIAEGYQINPLVSAMKVSEYLCQGMSWLEDFMLGIYIPSMVSPNNWDFRKQTRNK